MSLWYWLRITLEVGSFTHTPSAHMPLLYRWYRRGSTRGLAVLPAMELRARRRALGLTQAELAAALGIAANTIARWERGARQIGSPALGGGKNRLSSGEW